MLDEDIVTIIEENEKTKFRRDFLETIFQYQSSIQCLE